MWAPGQPAKSWRREKDKTINKRVDSKVHCAFEFPRKVNKSITCEETDLPCDSNSQQLKQNHPLSQLSLGNVPMLQRKSCSNDEQGTGQQEDIFLSYKKVTASTDNGNISKAWPNHLGLNR